MTNSKPGLDAGIDYEHFLDCVHCGLCTASCPTYLELGTEMDGPRGRIYLMRGVIDGRLELTAEATRHLELCLDCRACESACPSGVQYGRLIEPFRIAMDRQAGAHKTSDWFHRWVLFPIFPYAGRMRAALWPARLFQKLGLDRWLQRSGLLRWLPRQLQQMHAMLPRLGPALPALPELLPARGKRRARVALFTGCVGDAVFRHVHWATARVLQENGCDVLVPRAQTCCGAIHYHAGVAPPALERALQNAEAFETDIDAIIVNVAGCGAMLKDYHHLPVPAELSERMKSFSSRVRDVSEFLVQLGPVQPTGEIRIKATYHDACHLAHAQQVRVPPRKLLELIPGLKLAPLAESEVCCGAAGTYNFTETEMAERLVARKVEHIHATGADAVFIANAGCLLHIGRKMRETGDRRWLAHPIEALDLSYRRQQPPEPSQ